MINKETLIKNKKALIEIIIAGVLFLGELIWTLVYRFGGFAGVPLYRYGTLVEIMYLELDMSKLLVIFLNVDILYAVVVLLINSKSEKYNKVLEIFVAVLLFVAEAVLVLYVRYDAYQWNVWLDRYLVRLLIILAQINVVYIIAMLIINTKNYKLCKTIIPVLLAIIEFVTIWLFLTSLTFNTDRDPLVQYKAFMIVLAVFTGIWVLYTVGLKVFDFVYGKYKKDKDSVDVPATSSSDQV